MENKWKTYMVQEFANVVGGGTPKTKIAEYWNGTIPWLTPKDLSCHHERYISYGKRNISEEGLNKSSARLLPPKTVLLTSRAPVGYVAIAENEVCTNQGFRNLIVKEGFDFEFVYYMLSHNTEYLKQHASGSTFQELSGSTLKSLEFMVPPLSDQNAIAHILGSLDDKIELNRQINRTLEAMAQSIFKSWFVDFDPVRAKAEGRDPGLPNEIAAFFPDSFQDSDLGEIPKGWKVKEIRECCSKIQNGGTPKRSESDYWNPGTIPWLTSGEVRQTLITTTENMISELGLKKSSAKWLPKDSTVVALYGATSGQVALISSKMTTNQAVCGLIPKASFRYFNYLSLDRSVGILANLARGSAQQNISKGIVETTKVIIPRADILESFDHVVSSMFDKWIANLEESKSLASLRDTLLPKLISGELRIPEAEKLLEDVV